MHPTHRGAALAGTTAAMTALSWVVALAVAAASGLREGLLVNPFETALALALLPSLAFALSIEALAVGWARSSLRKLLVGGSASSLSDIAYVGLYLTGVGRLIGIVGLLGAGLWLEHHVSASAGLSIAGAWPLWLGVPALYLWGSFWGYWEHRFEHSRWMWSLHASHHSAEEFNVLNVVRSHPIEWALNDVANLLVPASLGFSPEAIAVTGAIFVFQTPLLHSNWTGLAWLERFGVITPAGHRLHHGVEARYHDRNFGEALNIWDRLFGTYVAPGPDIDAVKIGVDAPAGRHNTLDPLREIWLQTLDWLTSVRREAAAAFTPAARPAGSLSSRAPCPAGGERE